MKCSHYLAPLSSGVAFVLGAFALPALAECGSAAGVLTHSVPTMNLCTSATASSVMTSGSSSFVWTCTFESTIDYCQAPRGRIFSASGGPNGSVAPASQMVGPTETASVSITPDSGYTAVVASSCGGMLNGTTYTGMADQDCTISASFQPITNQYMLSVNKTGTGLGWIISDLVGIDCFGSCSASYPAGTMVTLTAEGDATTQFVGWSGACSGTGSCTVTMNAATNVAARFESLATSNPTGTAVGNTALYWATGGDAEWQIDNSLYQSGTSSQRSGTIRGDQHSSLMTTVRGPGTLSFYWKVSSEAGHDPLGVWVDFEHKAEISGEVDWTRVDLQIPAGQHDINWVYQKDATGTAGADAGWIDSITMAPFTDVAGSSWAANYVSAIYSAGITTGCGNGNYCATQNVTRDQMAAFIVRAKEGEPATGCATPPFADVPTTNTFCKYIQRMSALGVTTGCGNGNYCPTQTVSRDQMAVFIIRALEGDPAANYCGTGSAFADIATNHWACRHIKRMLELNVTTGCGGGNYCPAQLVTREQMAAFLARAFLGM